MGKLNYLTLHTRSYRLDPFTVSRSIAVVRCCADHQNHPVDAIEGVRNKQETSDFSHTNTQRIGYNSLGMDSFLSLFSRRTGL
jgi:hypothetical protein